MPLYRDIMSTERAVGGQFISEQSLVPVQLVEMCTLGMVEAERLEITSSVRAVFEFSASV